MGTVNVFLGPSATSQNSADYSLDGWSATGAALTLTSWSWTETGNGGYVLSHANLIPGCSYWLRKTSGGTPWAQGEIAANVIADIQSGLATAAQVSAIGSGVGAALNFEVNDDNTGTTGDTILDSVTQRGNAGATTFGNTQADNNVYHTILSVDTGGGVWVIDWVYKFAAGGGRNATKFVARAFMSAVGDTCLIQAYDFVGGDWETLGTITGTTETLYDLPLYTKHTGTGANAGNVYIRFINTGDQADTQTLNIDLAYVQAQNLGQTTGYADGSLWVKATGTAGTTPYVNATADNPAPWASVKTLNTTLGFNRYVVSPGTTITLDAALTGSVMRGRSYTLALGGQNISSSYFEGIEALSGIGTTATGEAIFCDSHVGTVTLGEFDMVRCHLHGTITMSAASKYYRMHDCTGIENAIVEFGAATQTLALSNMSGAITITGMTTGDTLYVDGNGVLTLGATCDAGTVHISGNIELTNSGSGQTITYGATALGNMAHGGAGASLTLGAGASISKDDDSALVISGTNTNGIGIEINGVTAGIAIVASAGNALEASGGGGGLGLSVSGGAGILNGVSIANDAGDALTITSSGGDGHGISVSGNGTGKDINAPDSDLGVWDQLTADHNTQGTFGRRVKNIAQDLIFTGTAVAGSTSNTIVFDTDASATDGAYDPAEVSIISGTGAGQTRLILSYTGASRTAVVDRDWRVTPSTDSEYVIVSSAGREHVNEGLAQAGAASTITLNTNASSANNAYVGQICFIRSGTGADQARRVASYDGSTKIATMTRAWNVTPDATSAYVMLPTGALSYQCLAEGVWNAVAASYAISGSTGEALSAPVTLGDVAHGGSSASLTLGAGASITKASGDALTITATDGHAINATAGGTEKAGIYAKGAALGESHGIYGEGGTVSGSGICGSAIGTGAGIMGWGGDVSGAGIQGEAFAGDSAGIAGWGNSAGDGIAGYGGDDGDGAGFYGGVTSGNGAVFVKGGGAKDIDADEIDSILTDTNELQSDWVDTGRLDTILDTAAAGSGGLTAQETRDAMQLAPTTPGSGAAGSIDDQLATIVADTNELQTDWVNGGRLDLLLDTAAAGGGSGSGTGASHVTITVIDANSNPVSDCEVWITSDSDGTTVVAGPLVTDDDGTVEFLLDAGVTYYCWRRKAGYNFTNPSTFVASGD